jgi:uncharacterized protein
MSEAPVRNRLAQESSPYLRQHAHNPVDWYPWGDEALSRARAEDKPIFLSIGYAACHWCHVMERESFEDPAIAARLNADFVPIKVDREERPDLDAIYMAAVQAMTGSGGWPLSVFLTPRLHPFFGGTYYPPESRYGMPSFPEVLAAVAAAWRDRRGDVEANAAQVASHIAGTADERGPAEIDVERAQAAALATLASEFDGRHGGFGGAPKFPTPSRLFFLTAHARRSEAARNMLSLTLDRMAAGGMYDWLGGGFHRYSVDREWLVPHFEKMLYDNALLARAYGEAGLLLGRDDWVEVARATADYLLREMRGPEGAFFSSTDADSEGQEGAYFTWTPDQVRRAVPREQAELVISLCELGASGRLEGGRGVLRPLRPLEAVAGELGVPPARASAVLASARAGLLVARGARTPPATDDKRLAGWNGMAAWALAWLGAAVPEGGYLDAARRAAHFLLEQRGPDGRLVRSWRAGVASGAETLEDVAWVSAALVQLYEADGAPAWLAAARELIDARLPHYRDGAGALLDTPDDGPELIMRPRSPIDGATPAASGVLASTLLRLSALTGEEAVRQLAELSLRAESAAVGRAPEATTTLLEALAAASRPPITLVVVGDPSWNSTAALVHAAWRFRPAGCAVAVSPSVPVPPAVAAAVPLFAGREATAPGRALAYLCEGGSCRLPTSEPDELTSSLATLAT